MSGFNESQNEIVYELTPAAYEVFKQKGEQNAVKVRRILQLTNDLAHHRFHELRILDLGCGEGVYSIEAALKGANIVAIDGRTERMNLGRSIAEAMRLSNANFLQQDVRNISKEQFGEFDVIYFLGLLYHLDAPDVFALLPTVYDLCKSFVIMDTHIALEGKDTVFDGGTRYEGIKVWEHRENDGPEMIQSRLASSLGNISSFHFTKESLLRLLQKIGFTSALECYVPFEPTTEKEQGNRITLVAMKGKRVKISSYPCLNNMSEDQIKIKMKELGAWYPYWESPKDSGLAIAHGKTQIRKNTIKNGINRIFRIFGYELRPIEGSQ